MLDEYPRSMLVAYIHEYFFMTESKTWNLWPKGLHILRLLWHIPKLYPESIIFILAAWYEISIFPIH